MTPDPLPPTKPPPKDEKDGGSQNAASPYAMLGAGVQLVVTVVLLALAGRWLDRRLDVSPWCLMAGMLIGIVGGFYHLWRQALRQ